MTLRDWDFSLLEELIESRGTDVILETGMACTCRNGDTFASTIERENMPASMRRLHCPQCQGDGWVYRNGRIVRGLLVNLDPGKNKALIETGYAIPGDAVFSPSFINGENISDFDKITLMFSQPVNEGQVIMRGSASLENNKLIPTDLNTNEDRLWYLPDYTLWCEDENGVVYSQDVDFVFEGRKVQWIGNSPAIGTLYTIKYNGFTEWIVYSQKFIRVDLDRSLGPRVLLRKKHVVFLQSSPMDSPAQRQEDQVAFTTKVKI